MSDIVKDMQNALNKGSTPLTLDMILEEINQSKGKAKKGKARKAPNSPGKKGGRLATDISKEDFLEKVRNFHNSKSYTVEIDWLSKDANELFSLDAFMESTSVKKDLSKILFDTENNTASLEMSPFSKFGNLMGLHSLDNGLRFIGFSSGGDWEWPIFVIIYWDGKSFRGYIPTSGNCVNTIFQCAFGSEMDSEYGPYGANAQMMDSKYEGLEDMELMIQCFDDLGMPERDEKGIIPLNWTAIEEDIRYRIAVS